MRKLLFASLFLLAYSGYTQMTYVPDDEFEQRLEDFGYGNGVIDDYVFTSMINNVISLYVQSSSSGEIKINDLTGIEGFTNLEILNCYENNLTALDLSNNVLLTGVTCSKNNLTALDLSNNPNLETLSCYENNLTALDLSNNVLLTGVTCSKNNLTALDLSNNPNLEVLICDQNNLTALDVSNATNLQQLICYNNNIMSLNLSENIYVSVLSCIGNNLNYLNVKNGNNSSMISFNTQFNPNLTCIEVDDPAASYLSGWFKDAPASYSLDCGSSLSTCNNMALKFDGSDDRITIPHHTDYQLGFSDFAIEAWIKADRFQTKFPRILTHRSHSQDGFLFGLKSSGYLMVQLNGTSLTSTSGSLRDNLCHHVAVTRNGDLITFYVDGIVSGTISIARNIDTDVIQNMYIGFDNSGVEQPFNGEIDNVRLWNVNRTSSEIFDNMHLNLTGSEPGLIGNWNFDSDIGNQIAIDNGTLENDGMYGISTTGDVSDPLLVNRTCGNGNASFLATNTCDVYTFTPDYNSLTASYAWDFDGDGVDDAFVANPTHTYPAPGIYNTRLTVTEDGCANFVDVTIDFVSCVAAARNIKKKDYEENSIMGEMMISAHPNPSKTGVFNLETIGFISEKTIRVLDPTGKIVFDLVTSDDQVKIDLSGFTKGLYFIRVSDTTNQKIEKIIFE